MATRKVSATRKAAEPTAGEGPRLQDRVALVTGSSRGLGADLALAFAREGARVVITYRRGEEGEARRAHELAKESGAELCLPFDVRERASVRDLMQAVAGRCGSLDVLVNCASVSAEKEFGALTDEDLDELLRVDLLGAILCCQEALPFLGPGSRVINLGPHSLRTDGSPTSPPVAVARAGVEALTRSLSELLEPRGVTVNCLTRSGTEAKPVTSDEITPPLPGEFASSGAGEAAVFLASAASGTISGRTFDVGVGGA